MYFTHVFHSWREAAPPSGSSKDNDLAKQTFLRLECRLLVCLYQSATRPCSPHLAPLGLDPEETFEAVETVKRWLAEVERQHDLGSAWTCCLDPYEITSVGIMCLAIDRTPQLGAPSRRSTACNDVYVLAVSLLSYLSSTYPAAAQMRRALTALHRRDNFMREACLREMEVSKSVPRKICTLLLDFPLGD